LAQLVANVLASQRAGRGRRPRAHADADLPEAAGAAAQARGRGRALVQAGQLPLALPLPPSPLAMMATIAHEQQDGGGRPQRARTHQHHVRFRRVHDTWQQGP